MKQKSERERLPCALCGISATVIAWKNNGGVCPNTNNCSGGPLLDYNLVNAPMLTALVQ